MAVVLTFKGLNLKNNITIPTEKYPEKQAIFSKLDDKPKRKCFSCVDNLKQIKAFIPYLLLVD